MTEPPPTPDVSGDRIPVGRALMTAFLLRRFGLLPLLAIAIAGLKLSPDRRRLSLTVAAAGYAGALGLLLFVVLSLASGMALLALIGP